MCGIVGYIGKRDVAPLLLEGLQRLEYRGYDSAGIVITGKASAGKPAALKMVKAKGRVRELEARIPKRFTGTTGIAHTRWATHGAPSDENAHPHLDADHKVAVVHNGIIDNASELRAKLVADGVVFLSETDTEVLVHLIARAQADTLEEKVREALRSIEGTYGIAVMHADFNDRIVVARNGSPVVLGIGEKEMFVASDVAALVTHTRQVVTLDDGEMATLKADDFRTYTTEGSSTTATPTTVEWEAESYDMGGHDTYMHKEISEQADAVDRVLRGRIDDRFSTVHLGGLNLDAREARGVRRIKILGCGTSYHAGQIGAQLIEELARIPADAEPASEFRYRNPVVDPDTLYVAVSQSGETYDVLAAVQELKRKGARVLGVVNVVGSAIAREADGGTYVHAGPEVCVVSTKCFTNTVVAFALLALHLGRIRDLSVADGKRIIEGLRKLPAQITEILENEDEIKKLAAEYADAKSMMFIGRVRGYPVAREASLKLKEVSYIHAEAYPASELKHGPLALIEPAMPTVAIVPDDELLEKNRAAMEEIKARSGRILAVAHQVQEKADHTIVVPKNENELDPILMGIPLQLFAYHTALAMGRDIDKPRNLAKSVTVE
ncbi:MULTISPECIES: glutamine--fructose-6-phosphate transaminase (isomerizing) [Streptomyces]|jgi:glucosamine--fructose-6-phosphate aminotransferase (isomerizing)|uniref:Glutamine--fructose-6-phosphate aminotransferase [isomerizing] n=1 Tax=Streptomyces sp. 900116325 TaxID=3154295 RepID=A0ABV2UGW4_9ACTN|nr:MULTISPECIES: glutamine--fructose-6-phosphate transaminase (isomerizing) [unclassified Streptomyces]MDX2728302.1 glutamine--fructose-6-phosphate transaminase (isomerizing) [Streptomyces sp. PA03-2a]MDX3769362.1 glutamine--fructose-6-phosphate transaminase (isomerizing) [Streptomyces sp. AK08-01B]MDX3818426.1 glutamine--fructose-6-phosphate transaminase (isomerizing) [Streptomyces sp. AK08-01A]WSG81215.1 glutamine--fructose-6-phosphate transaminase (isomerizing) [Streptomyces sp. NBC_01727]W